MSLEECINAFNSEIFQQDIALWVLLVLGVLIVLSGLFVLMFKEQRIPNVVILLLIGGAFVFAARIGQIPLVSGALDKPVVANVELQQTHRAACIERELARASDVPENLPEAIVEVKAETTSSALTNVATEADEKSLVWIFYDQNRKADAEILGAQLLSVDVTTIVEPDDFAQVANKQPAGTTRIIFNDDQFAKLSQAIAELASVEEIGDAVVLQGPYSSILRGPVQLQLY